MMKAMTEDRTQWQWPRLAAAIRAARESRGLRQIDLATLAGVSEGTVQNLEDPERRPSRMPPSLASIEPHLGWAPRSGAAILRGGDPTPIPVTHEASASLRAGKDKLRDKYSLRVVTELESDDPLIDSAVIQLPGTKDARMTVVIHGSPDATPEEIQKALLAWRKAEQELRRLPDADSGDDEPRAANGS